MSMSTSNPPSPLPPTSLPHASAVSPKITLFGDSLTAWSFDTVHGRGIGDVLKSRFDGRASVENEGWPGQTSNTLHNHFHNTILASFTPANPPLLITIFLGANDAVFSPQVHVPLDTFISNIRSFIEAILRSPSTSTTKILLITPPPINVREAIPGNIKLKCETIEKSLTQLEFECRESLGFKTWVSKLQYAEAIVRLANEFRENGEARVAVVDFWRAIMNYGLGQEGRGNLEEGEIDTSGSGKWPGCGLPEAKEFGNGVFTDRLHLGEKGYWVLSAEVLKVLDDKWPGLL